MEDAHFAKSLQHTGKSENDFDISQGKHVLELPKLEYSNQILFDNVFAKPKWDGSRVD